MSESMMSFSKANFDFAVDLYKEIKNGRAENLFMSPFSVYVALGMTLAGAKGETKVQMFKGLRLKDESDEVHMSIADVTTALEKLNKDVCMDAANKIYVKTGFPLEKDFLGIITKIYNGLAEQVDFNNEPVTRKLINSWVEEKTREKIKDIIPPGLLTSLTRLVLVNAVYFKGDWKFKFDKQQTQKAPFYLLNGDVTQVDMMHIKKHFKIGMIRELNSMAIEIPYKGDSVSMYVLLPRKKDGLPELESKLTGEHLLNIVKGANMMSQQTDLFMPRFKLEDTIEMSEMMQKLGMNDLFSRKADLSGISTAEPLFVSNVLHKAFINVDEEGTEAAAATAMMVTTCMIPPPFKIDRPFLFMIAERSIPSLLFTGSVLQLN